MLLILRFAMFLVCLLSVPVWAHHPGHSKGQVALTATEHEFLAAHPVIRLGISDSWAPNVIRLPSGELEGFDVDLLEEINAATGTQIELVAGDWSELVEQAKSLELDGLALSAANEERKEFFLFSDTYLPAYPTFVVAGEDKSTYTAISDFYGKTVAILTGNKFNATMLAAHPQITVAEQPSEADAIRMVLEGKATAAVVATIAYDKHRKVFAGLIRIGHIATDRPLNALYSIRKDWPELVSIINKGLAALSVDDYNVIYHRWFGMEPPIVLPSDTIVFTAAEQAWLEQKHVVRAHAVNYPPYHAFKDGRAQGMAIDYLDIAAQRGGFKIEYVDSKSWSQSLADIRVPRNVDLLPAAYNTLERREYLAFTKAALVTPSVIFVREDSPFVSSLADLAGKTVVVKRDFGPHHWLEEDFPELELHVVGTTEEALRTLSNGEVDAYVGSLTVATYIVKTRGLTNLKIAAPSPFGNDEQAIAVRRDWPELASIIDKVLATMKAAEHAAIHDRWLPPIQYDSGISGQDVFRWIVGVSAFLLAIIAVILIWNRKLGEEIAARAALENQLRQSEEKYRTLFERSTDALLIIEGDRFIDCNDATIQMLGVGSRDDIVNIHPWELSPPTQQDGQASKEKAAEMIATALENGSHRFEWDHTRASGEVFPVEVQLTTISRGENPIVHVVWRDITVRKNAEKIREELTEELLLKNHELERFTYTVSHDLKSPLITIQGFSGILAKSLGDRLDDDVRMSLGFIDSAAKKMFTLLEDLLALSRIGRVVKPDESVCLTDVAREARELIEGLLVDIEVTIEIAEDLPRVVGDRTRLREVMQNLLENAVKYRGDQPKLRIEIGVADNDGKQDCYVRDNGMGILPQYHEKVFGLFERLSNDQEGTGVGLAQVKRIVELHGGRVWIESAGDGQGTTFWFTLPWEKPASA